MRLKRYGDVYILGSIYRDGVCFVANRKLTYEDGTWYEYDDELIGDICGIIVGFSDDTTLDNLVLKLSDIT